MEKQILIIEDDKHIREVVKDILDIEGYNVIITHDGQHGLDLITKGLRPDLILLDIYMPGMDGKTFIKEFQSQFPTLITTNILVMSAAAASDLPDLKVHLRIIKKPLDIDDLINAVRELV